MAKKIVRAARELNCVGGECYANAHAAIDAMDEEMPPQWLLGDKVYDNPPPPRFKLSVRVRFTRTDGKVVSRRILKTVDEWCFSGVYRRYWGDGEFQFDEVYSPGEVRFA